ncbi:S41 family peptidase [Dokdonella sp.]|uniref:S41 family peptidase n=1 Tax=Dokdonella sp. TaxID=2291710 RepID=UPI0025BCE629|nr:S41 family peptidase [Dokdonella sp.]MBX3688790.1 PD40 domain-containing protein [Dokdonella sp.]
MKRVSLLTLAGCACIAGTALAAPGYYREPALHGDTVVFVSEGDLWRVSAKGGAAQRLTTHPAAETQPVISADGRKLAFVASYDGAPDVYEMPISGGEPQRLTFEASRAWLSGFGPHGEVIYASDYVIGPGMSRALRSVDPASGQSRDIPLADARELAYAEDGKSAWFTRFGLAVSGDNAVGYRGGGMAQLWHWATDDKSEAVRIAADMDANISQPMPWQGRLYVVSDVGGRANLWSMDDKGGDRRQLTRYKDFDVRGARLDGGRIVYQLGADLHLYDIASSTDRQLEITLDSDFLQRRERFIGEPAKWIDQVATDGDGTRVVLGARGQAVVTGTKGLRRASLAVPEHARLREAVLSKDGKWVFSITELDGRSEIRRFPADGSATSKLLLADDGSYRLHLWPSPDGRWLAHSDKRARLSILDLDKGDNRVIDESPFGEDEAYGDVAWSADGHYLAWSRPASARQLPQIFLASATGGAAQPLSSDRYESVEPAFSPDGQWLYFLSNRNFVPTPGAPWGDRNLGPMFDKRTRIFALALQPGLRSPFQPVDELAPVEAKAGKSEGGKNDKGKDGAGRKGGEKKVVLPAVEFAGLSQRLIDTGIEPGNYSDLAVTGERLYVLDRAAGSFGKGELRTAAIEAGNGKLTKFLGDVRGFVSSGNGKRLLVVKSGAKGELGEILLLDAAAKAPDDMADARIAYSDWKIAIDPAAEWRQMFDDAWRMHQAYSFAPDMRGVDWKAVRTRLLPLVARVNDRLELDDLLGQMSSALGILHSQVRGGDYRGDPAAPAAAFLGAKLQAVDGGMRVDHIWRTDAELPNERAPLAQPGTDVREGDVISAVNGRAVATVGELARALAAQAGQQVLLDVKRGSAGLQAIVRPVSAERDAMLRYGDWVRGNLAKVEKAGKGRIGYLHLYAMGPNDIANFAREFYAQYDRDGLIIDVRRNRGGNIDSWVIEKLLRRAWEFWQPPHGAPTTNMQQAFRGHLVVLADEFTYSDGETFTAGVRALKLGPVIGMRTAGAGIWLSDGNRLVDKGLARVANTAQFDLQGRWLIEGRGVAPDIAVENLPWATAHGHDAQLEAALANLAERLARNPVPPLRAQPIPPVGMPAAVP